MHCVLLALPSKPLHSIALSDADTSSSLSFVKQKLHDLGRDASISGQETNCVEMLGGRASDLESVRFNSPRFLAQGINLVS